MPDMVTPSLGMADATDLCDQVYGSRAEALEVVRWLRAAGWIVPLLDTPPSPGALRPDGTRVLASVYHPVSYQSPGEVVFIEV